jgi:DNA polymerase-4
MSAPAALCRDCLARFPGGRRCPTCGSPRILQHPEIDTLSIAHLDCDAFYASVEKRDDPSLRDRPVIVGGGRRGVVTTACYIARIDGVRSAMPMFKALKLCPQAVVVKPRMDHYVSVSRQIRALMLDLTPLVEPLSLDEAFLDLSGTERLHHAPPAVLMTRLQNRILSEIGITVSVGLSHNKFLAKIASDLDKPRGFAMIGQVETVDFLSEKPVSLIWGVGRSATDALARDGIRTIADLRRPDRKALVARYGSMGDRLWHLAQGIDTRPVSPHRAPKSISTETTFDADIADPETLARILWRLSERVSARAKSAGLGGTTVTLKLKRTDFVILTRRHALSEPTQMADRLYRAALPMLHRDMEKAPFRLIGVGLSDLTDAAQADPSTDLLDPSEARRLAAERTADRIRARFGADSIMIGRSLR